ncbi:hypothetical protein J4H72_22750 [Vibrio alginolyticus]|uniref:hypothetical protein n=1 Tax=Vibrio harveyi group TaxID=717610 RepID=UPI001BD2D80C|nr:hypothetical protein [Vibrio alginolyticus]MBT0110495.1 hypothetical protein [Vibrio alginolyticus]
MRTFFAIWIGVIVLVSFLLTAFIPVDGFVKGMIAAPGVIGLCSALFQLVRDEATYKKTSKAKR